MSTKFFPRFILDLFNKNIYSWGTPLHEHTWNFLNTVNDSSFVSSILGILVTDSLHKNPNQIFSCTSWMNETFMRVCFGYSTQTPYQITVIKLRMNVKFFFLHAHFGFCRYTLHAKRFFKAKSMLHSCYSIPRKRSFKPSSRGSGSAQVNVQRNFLQVLIVFNEQQTES